MAVQQEYLCILPGIKLGGMTKQKMFMDFNDGAAWIDTQEARDNRPLYKNAGLARE